MLGQPIDLANLEENILFTQIHNEIKTIVTAGLKLVGCCHTYTQKKIECLNDLILNKKEWKWINHSSEEVRNNSLKWVKEKQGKINKDKIAG